MDDSSLKINISVEDKEIKSGLKSVMADFKALKSDINKNLENVTGLKTLENALAATGKALDDAKQKFTSFREVETLSQQFEAQSAAVETARAALEKAGVDTGDLVAAQTALRQRLADSTKEFQSMADVAGSRDFLGLKAHKDIQAQIEKTKQAYQILTDSQTLTAKEQAQAYKAMSDRIANLKTQTNGWADSLKQARVAILAASGAFAAFGSGMKKAIQGAIGDESAFSGIKKVTAGTPEQFAALSNEIVKMTRTIPGGVAGLSKFAEAGGKIGLPVDEIARFTEKAAKMGRAFNMPAEEIGAAVGGMQASLRTTTDETAALGDTILALSKGMGATGGDLIKVMTGIAGSAKSFGLAHDNAAALAAAMLDLGRAPEEATTAINNLLSRLQSANVQAPKFKDALAQIGVGAAQMAALVADNPQKAINTLLEALAKLDGPARAEALTEIFGPKRQGDIAILVNGLDAYQKALAIAADKEDNLGGVDRAFAASSKGTTTQLDLLKNGLQEISNSIGRLFTPGINQAAGELKELANAVADFIKEYPNLTRGIVLATGALSLAAVAWTAHKAIYLAFPGLIGPVVSGFRNISTAAAGMGAAINSLVAPSGGGATIKDVLIRIRAGFSSIPGAVIAGVTKTDSAVAGFFTRMKTTAADTANSFKSKMSSAISATGEAFRNPGAAASAFGTKMKTVADSAVTGAGNMAKAIGAIRLPVESLSHALGALSLLWTAWEVGQEIGAVLEKWLSQFDWFKQAMNRGIYEISMGWANLKMLWAELWRDNEAIQRVNAQMREIQLAYQAGLEELGKKKKDSAAERLAAEKQASAEWKKTIAETCADIEKSWAASADKQKQTVGIAVKQSSMILFVRDRPRIKKKKMRNFPKNFKSLWKFIPAAASVAHN